MTSKVDPHLDARIQGRSGYQNEADCDQTYQLELVSKRRIASENCRFVEEQERPVQQG